MQGSEARDSERIIYGIAGSMGLIMFAPTKTLGIMLLTQVLGLI